MQEFQPFRLELVGEHVDASEVAARPGEAADKTEPDGILSDQENDGNRCGSRFGGERCSRASRRDNQGSLPADQLGCHLCQTIEMILRPSVDDRHIPALCKSDLFQTLAEGTEAARHGLRWSTVEKTDDRHHRLLRLRRERPCGCGAAHEPDEIAPSHSITSSAMATSDGGTVRPSVLAVSPLITNSNLVDCTTGMSAGFAPLRMLPV